MTDGPESPPLIVASRLSNRRFEDCFFGPWHLIQRSTRIGRTRDSKNSIASGENAAMAAVFDFVSSAEARHAAPLAITTSPARSAHRIIQGSTRAELG